MIVVINQCFGGFSVSRFAAEWMINNGYDPGKEFRFDDQDFGMYFFDCPRHHPALIEVIKIFGSEKVSGQCAKLKFVEIPDGADYKITGYDGMENAQPAQRTWYANPVETPP